jgi:NitT/TauT family transport system substrate-binding protein
MKQIGMKSPKQFVLVVIIIAAILAVFLGSMFYLDFYQSPQGYTGKAESITIGYSPFEQNALLWIAQDQHFFEANGLKVTLRKYDTGVGSLDGMLNGETDITAGVTEFPMVGKAFKKESIRIIGTIAKTEQIYLVGRKDRGIENYGDIDAIATAQPYANLAKKRLGANAVVWPAQGSQSIFGLIVSTNERITNYPEPISRFLKSLAQAEEYTISNPVEAKAIVQKQLNVDAEYMETIWSQDQFSLSLDQSLILAMEDEARWMINNNLTTEKNVPDFLDYIYEDDLKSIKPEAVNIIR